MDEFELTTPVIFMVFRRPETTRQVFEQIRQVKPKQLLVIADGPRSNRRGEEEECQAVRAVIDTIDWDCELLKNYADSNLGCRSRVAGGLDWAFELVEEAIILEDDCVPHPSFFLYCQELLARYRDDRRVMTISGNNFQFGRRRTPYSYYFSRFPHMWGWATWRRAWQWYDVTMQYWPEIRDGNWLSDIMGSMWAEWRDRQIYTLIGNQQALEYWQAVFEATYQGEIDTWDYQMTFASWLNNGLHILPDRNLVSNVGFGPEATHTKQAAACTALPAVAMEFPLRHPPYVIRDAQADSFTQVTHFG
ncbi:MAG TPA: glycosyltransferase family 2 protein [Methylomusa anaerophila]|uniref:Hemolytic protein HlpA-like protein n=1 Tax=Methylomusa anaerophila TaxID=1930071 RepID=A0A348ALJ1_9FIRM|nr:glycosyltransferase family 2 protein [Methylomusa anaerophila]BBB91939.1 hypothetical protein MAMMFC1_02624 [Methylomusa anaerophila]HML88049.1 glycosyltransferase family 2 protein [Methylomusa anaerophila]